MKYFFRIFSYVLFGILVGAMLEESSIPEPFTTPLIIEHAILEVSEPVVEELPEESRHNIVPDYAKEIYDGVYFSRVRQVGLNPLTYHVVWIELDTPNLHFMTTPPMGDLDTQSMRVSQFVERYGLDLAINGDGWRPWDSELSIPAVGQDVNITSFQMSEGQIVSNGMKPYTIYISGDNQVSIGKPVGNLQNAISGLGTLLKDGEIDSYAQDGSKHPRTIIGLSEDESVMIWIVIDGRQPLSLGASLYDSAKIAQTAGAYDAVNMDGGGSSTMVKGTDTGYEMLNNPCEFRQKGWERSIGNQIGLWVEK